jgi:hypothetical protein
MKSCVNKIYICTICPVLLKYHLHTLGYIDAIFINNLLMYSCFILVTCGILRSLAYVIYLPVSYLST